MGCFNEVDAITRLAILSGDKVVCLLAMRLVHKANRKAKMPRTVTTPMDMRISMLPAAGYDRVKVFRGTYDDYGGLNEVDTKEFRDMQGHAATIMLRESTMEFVLQEFKSRYKQDQWDRKNTKDYAGLFDKRNKRLADLIKKKGKYAVSWGVGMLSCDRFKLDADFDTLMKAHIEFEHSLCLPIPGKERTLTDEEFAIVDKYADEWNDVIFPLFWYCCRCHINPIGTTEMGTQARFFGMSRSLAEFTAKEATRILGSDRSMKHYDEL